MMRAKTNLTTLPPFVVKDFKIVSGTFVLEGHIRQIYIDLALATCIHQTWIPISGKCMVFVLTKARQGTALNTSIFVSCTIYTRVYEHMKPCASHIHVYEKLDC